jgi:23S rRNA pseudouridine1911/1915/1917 synthase
VDASDGDRSLVSIHLETGRHHQIRVQLAAIGCPVAGDMAYGADKAMPDGRIALMARRLAFTHPTLKTRLVFEAVPPREWPWPLPGNAGQPLWTFEDFQRDGLGLA